MSLSIYLLGQFKLQANQLPIELPSRPAQSLLAYLVLNKGVTHRREKLAGILWPNASESNARNYLRQALWRIRKALESASLKWEDYLKINDITITFNEQSDYWLDVSSLLEEENDQTVEEDLNRLRLYRGELLAGFYDEWIERERDRLRSAYHEKMARVIGYLCQAQRWRDVLKWAEEWLIFARERLRTAFLTALAQLIEQRRSAGDYVGAIDAAATLLRHEPLREDVVRTLSEPRINAVLTP